jgi:hypothetical protein
MKVPEDAGVAA